MAQNYASEVLAKIDERFYLESKTKSIINNGIDISFEGVNSVTIYNVDVVSETNYVRSGYQRFGQLVELGTGTQTFILSQDKAFTFSVDRGNLEDSKMIQSANKAVKRQIREVSIPTTDIYRLGILDAYARAASQGATAALTSTTIFDAILVELAALENASVPTDDMVLYITPTLRNALFTDPKFKIASPGAYSDNKTGTMSPVLGMEVIVCPTTYFPANFNFMIVSKNVLISPTKINMIRLLTEVQGIDGTVAEGRRYYDAFIPTYKGKAIRAHHAA